MVLIGTTSSKFSFLVPTLVGHLAIVHQRMDMTATELSRSPISATAPHLSSCMDQIVVWLFHLQTAAVGACCELWPSRPAAADAAIAVDACDAGDALERGILGAI